MLYNACTLLVHACCMTSKSAKYTSSRISSLYLHRDAAVPYPQGSRSLEATVAATLPPEPLTESGALQLELTAAHDLRLPAPLVVTRRLRSVFAHDTRWRGRHELEARAVMAPSVLHGWSAATGCTVRDVGGRLPGVMDVSMELSQRREAAHGSSVVHRRWAHHQKDADKALEREAHTKVLAASRVMVRGAIGCGTGGRVCVAGGVAEVRAGIAHGVALTAGVKTPPPDALCGHVQPACWAAAAWHASVELRNAARLPPGRAVVRVDGSAAGVRVVECSVRHHVPVFGKARAWLTWRTAEAGPHTTGGVGDVTKRSGSSIALRCRVGKVPRLPVVEVLPAPMVEVHVGVGVRTRSLQSCGLQLCW